jgi:hypothetical protein
MQFLIATGDGTYDYHRALYASGSVCGLRLVVAVTHVIVTIYM